MKIWAFGSLAVTVFPLSQKLSGKRLFIRPFLPVNRISFYVHDRNYQYTVVTDLIDNSKRKFVGDARLVQREICG